MNDARDLIKAINDMENAILDSTKVIICCAEVKKIIEECGEIPPNCYVIEISCIPPNKAYNVEDRELKKVLIKMQKERKENERFNQQTSSN